MAIALDNAVAFGVITSGVGKSFTVTGSNNFLVVTIQQADNATDSVTNVTYNGVAMTRAAAAFGGTNGAYVYYLFAPATGTHNVVVTFSGSSHVAAAANYTGCAQSGTPGSNSLDDSTVGAHDVTLAVTVAANSWLAGSIIDDSGNLASLLGVTNCETAANPGSTGDLWDSNGPFTAGSHTLGWHYSGSSRTESAIVEVMALATPSGGSHLMGLMGLGM